MLILYVAKNVGISSSIVDDVFKHRNVIRSRLNQSKLEENVTVPANGPV